MRDLIVYYSLEGNTEYVVNRIKEKTGADTLRDLSDYVLAV